MDGKALFEKVRRDYANRMFPSLENLSPGEIRLPNQDALMSLCNVIGPLLPEEDTDDETAADQSESAEES